MSRFRPINREIDYLLPPSVQDWLPESHLARYVVEVVEGLDLSKLESVYAGRGSAAYHPAMLLSLLIYGYATGAYSSRKIERASYDSLAFRFIACDQHPDHDTLASFRRRHGEQFAATFVQVLQIARENQVSRFGTVSLDGTKIHANASRHSALSYAHAEKIEAQLKAEVQEMLKLAEAADQSDLPDGVSLPDEIKRREDRLAAIAEAKTKIEARAKERLVLVMAPHVTQAGNDKEQVVPMLAKLQALPEELNQPEKFLADSGYFSEKNVEACEAARIEPLIAVGRDAHHRHWRERFEEPAASSEPTSPVDKMKHRLKTKAGRAAYGQRKQTVEPVFGIIKSVMGFRQFLLRGLANVQNEWTLVCLAWNLKRMATLRPHSVQNA
ncbi:transposase [Pseudomonas aeruginosa]|uniref:transposase n=1 Tax=Pseudomonas aeruginosa TaxID=287 RepID=UPI000717A369|nr:transposase [Pseudomonas aeruginosa]KRU67315.1 transposase [Pseudomonas aeruginosa]